MSYEIEIGKFVSFPLKKTNDVNLADPMNAFVTNNLNKVCLDSIQQQHIIFLLNITNFIIILYIIIKLFCTFCDQNCMCVWQHT